MRVLLLTYGTRGDVQPFVALGRGLAAAGHSVVLATSRRFAAFVPGHGLAFAPLDDGLLALIDAPEGRAMVETTTNPFQALRHTLAMTGRLGARLRAVLDDGWTAAERAVPDLIVFHPKALGGAHFAEALGVPAVLALPVPMLVPTAERPCPGFPALPLGGAYNRLTYAAVGALLSRTAGPQLRAWRAARGLPRPARLDPLHAADGRALPVLHAVSAHVVPRPADWPATARLTGYWFLGADGDAAADAGGWTPPPALAAFLDRGPPPVCVGFGSMAGRDPAGLATTVVEGLRQAGVRGVLVTGGDGLRPGVLADDMLAIDQAPHDWLFPRTAAVVHHGGAGTTAAALRAGCPSVVVPVFGDQPFWGDRVRALGAGPAPLARRRLTASRLAAALTTATGDPAIARAAAALGRAIRAEDGVATAIALLEGLGQPA